LLTGLPAVGMAGRW